MAIIRNWQIQATAISSGQKHSLHSLMFKMFKEYELKNLMRTCPRVCLFVKTQLTLWTENCFIYICKVRLRNILNFLAQHDLSHTAAVILYHGLFINALSFKSCNNWNRTKGKSSVTDPVPLFSDPNSDPLIRF